jgi:hypothetical protein
MALFDSALPDAVSDSQHPHNQPPVLPQNDGAT